MGEMTPNVALLPADGFLGFDFNISYSDNCVICLPVQHCRKSNQARTESSHQKTGVSGRVSSWTSRDHVLIPAAYSSQTAIRSFLNVTGRSHADLIVIAAPSYASPKCCVLSVELSASRSWAPASL